MAEENQSAPQTRRAEENHPAPQTRRAEENHPAPQSRRPDDHAGAIANAEQHLSEAHKLSVQIQGKEGSWGHAVWALIREEKGKVKTLTVFEGTRREAANHFFSFIHPNLTTAPSAAAQGPQRSYGGGSRGGRPQGRPPGRPPGRPQGSPQGGPQGRPPGRP